MSRRDWLFIFFNLTILISTVIITIIDVIYGTSGGQSNFLVQGWNYFMPFTINSNVLMAIAAGIALVKLFLHRRKNFRQDGTIKPFGRKLTNFYFMTTVSLNLTAVTVALFLMPLRFINGENGFTMFAGDMFFFHLINPILAVYSFLYLLDGTRINKTSRLLCFIIPMAYSTVYSIHVLILKDWDDFYNYTFGGNYALSLVSATANLVAIYTIATLFANAYNKRSFGARTGDTSAPKIILPSRT